MNRIEAWFVHISTILVGVTGVVYAVMRYLMEPVDLFSVVNHPWQPQVQHIHIIVAPLLIFAFGLIWKNHISDHYLRGLVAGRRTGLSMILTMAPMAVSGYLIQTAVHDVWRIVWIVVHCVTAFLWLAGYLVHQIIHFRRKRMIIQKAAFRSETNTDLRPIDAR